MRRLLCVLATLPLAIALIGCSSDSAAAQGAMRSAPLSSDGQDAEINQSAPAETQPTSIPPQVLDDYCLGLGYRIENRAPLPECEPFMVCVFPDNSDCSLSEFVSGICGAKYSYCEKQGGELSAGVFVGTCKLSSGKLCPELDYWRSTCGDE